MLNPRVLEKLIKHLSQNIGITVQLDYSKDAMPKTLENGTVVLPAWLDEKDAGKLLACVVHESGHGQYDVAEMHKLRLYGYQPAFGIVMNVINDVRIDVRRQRQYAGVKNLYKEIWAFAEEEYKKVAQDTNFEFINLLKSFLVHATNAPGCPELAEVAKKHPNFRKILDLLHTIPDKDGFLWKETLEMIDLLQIPPNQQGQGNQGQSGQQNQSQDQGQESPGQASTPGESPSKTLKSELERLTNKRTLNNVNEKIEKLADIQEKGLEDLRDRRKIQNSLARQLPHPSVLNQAIKNIPGAAGIGHQKIELHPANLETLPLTSVDVDEYNRTCVESALAKFFESTEETIGDPEVKHKIDTGALSRLLTYPNEILIGDTLDAGEDTTVVVLLDCSGSMEGTPIDLVVKTLKTIIDSGKSTNATKVKVGIVLFSDDAVTFKPITLLQEIDLTGVNTNMICGLIRMSGTSIQTGLEHSLSLLEEERARRKAIIVLTDGQVMPNEAQWIKDSWPMDIGLNIVTITSPYEQRLPKNSTMQELFKYTCHDEVTMPIALSESLNESAGGE